MHDAVSFLKNAIIFNIAICHGRFCHIRGIAHMILGSGKIRRSNSFIFPRGGLRCERLAFNAAALNLPLQLDCRKIELESKN